MQFKSGASWKVCSPSGTIDEASDWVMLRSCSFKRSFSSYYMWYWVSIITSLCGRKKPELLLHSLFQGRRYTLIRSRLHQKVASLTWGWISPSLQTVPLLPTFSSIESISSSSTRSQDTPTQLHHISRFQNHCRDNERLQLRRHRRRVCWDQEAQCWGGKFCSLPGHRPLSRYWLRIARRYRQLRELGKARTRRRTIGRWPQSKFKPPSHLNHKGCLRPIPR